MTAESEHYVVGIDLGTTNSLISIPEEDKPLILSNERGLRMTPSVVTVQTDRILVGELAKSQAVLNHENTVSLVKRQMGSEKTWTLSGREWTPEMISAEILKQMKRTAEVYTGKTIAEAVITVPAYFDDRQRLATMTAAELAGLKVCKLFNEPTAAALAYGLQQGQDDHLMVFDLGGGTLDITLLEIRDNAFYVRGVGGSTGFGGTDFDQLIVDHLRESFQQLHAIDLAADPIAMQQLISHSERAKIDLSVTTETKVMIPYVTTTAKGPVHCNMTLNRSTIEALFGPLLKDLQQILADTFTTSGIDAGWVQTVVFVGGASRTPCIRRLLATLLPDTVCFRQDINPEEIVAMGAGILAGILTGKYNDIQFQDITSHDLGIEDDNGDFIAVFHRGAAYPAEVVKTFTTTEDDQTSVTIRVMQNNENREEPATLGSFVLADLPPAKAGEPDIKVKFTIDSHGILRVCAEEQSSGVKGEILVSRV